MKKQILILFLLVSSITLKAQKVKTPDYNSFLQNKQWYVYFTAYQRTGVGDEYEKNKQKNLLVFKANNEYTLKFEGIERTGRYLIEGKYLLLFWEDETCDSDMSLLYDNAICVVFRIKILNTTSFEISSIAGLEAEGFDLTLRKY